MTFLVKMKILNTEPKKKKLKAKKTFYLNTKSFTTNSR